MVTTCSDGSKIILESGMLIYTGVIGESVKQDVDMHFNHFHWEPTLEEKYEYACSLVDAYEYEKLLHAHWEQRANPDSDVDWSVIKDDDPF